MHVISGEDNVLFLVLSVGETNHNSFFRYILIQFFDK